MVKAVQEPESQKIRTRETIGDKVRFSQKVEKAAAEKEHQNAVRELVLLLKLI